MHSRQTLQMHMKLFPPAWHTRCQNIWPLDTTWSFSFDLSVGIYARLRFDLSAHTYTWSCKWRVHCFWTRRSAPTSIASIVAPKQEIKNSCPRDTELRTTLFVFSLDMSVCGKNTYVYSLAGLKNIKTHTCFPDCKNKAENIHTRFCFWDSGVVLFARKHSRNTNNTNKTSLTQFHIKQRHGERYEHT